MDEDFELNEDLDSSEASTAYAVMMFRLMYPMVDVPTGRPCRDPECACDGANMEMSVICVAVN
jgi:hypothetical protein